MVCRRDVEMLWFGDMLMLLPLLWPWWVVDVEVWREGEGRELGYRLAGRGGKGKQELWVVRGLF